MERRSAWGIAIKLPGKAYNLPVILPEKAGVFFPAGQYL